MKKRLSRLLCVLMSALLLFIGVSCTPNTPADPSAPDGETAPTPEEITLVAATLQLPENSAFALSFSQENTAFNGVKTAMPSCANAFLNGLILDGVQSKVHVNTPEGASLLAIDVDAVTKDENLYSFSFVAHFSLSDGTRDASRFALSVDFTADALLTLGDVIKPAYFDNGSVQKYVSAYLAEHHVGKYGADTVALAPQDEDSFMVAPGGVTLRVKGMDGTLLPVYVGDAAISQYNRTGVTATEEPESAYSGDYQPAKEGEKVVAMTFDDGPGSTSTKRLLDYLEANDIKATFFVNGYNYSNLETNENAKQLLARAVSLGCEVGNHSYSHPYFQNLPPEQRTYQLEHNADLIEKACGVYPTLFRAPGGIFPEGMPEAEDYFYIYWDADGEDWKSKKDTDSGVSLAANYMQYIGPGSIVLMHDIYANSVDAAIIIMNQLKAQGYRFVTVSELLDLESKVPDGTIYCSQTLTRGYTSMEKRG